MTALLHEALRAGSADIKAAQQTDVALASGGDLTELPRTCDCRRTPRATSRCYKRSKASETLQGRLLACCPACSGMLTWRPSQKLAKPGLTG